MKMKKYSIEALKFINPDTDHIVEACLGLCGEVGEVVDVIKKNKFQGHDLDCTHLTEEIGDVVWYLNLLIKSLGITWEEVTKSNIDKLSKRYSSGKFKFEDSINREV